MLRKIGLTLLAPLAYALIVVGMVTIAILAALPLGGIVTVTLWRAFTQNKLARVK